MCEKKRERACISALSLKGILIYEIITSIMDKSLKRINNYRQKTMHKLLQNAIKYIIILCFIVKNLILNYNIDKR